MAWQANVSPETTKIRRYGVVANHLFYIQNKGVIKSGGGLGSKMADIVDGFLVIDYNQFLPRELT